MTQARAGIAAALRTSNSVLLVNHVEPDGDTLGSTLALALALQALGKRAVVASHDRVPDTYAFLPGAAEVVSDLPGGGSLDIALTGGSLDTALTMECTTPDRCGRWATTVLAAPLVIAMDHHQQRPDYAHLVDWDPTAAAVGEMVADLIAGLGVPVSTPMATALLTAIATDTGVFRYATVRPDTLRRAAALMESGADLAAIVTQVYETREIGATRLLGHVLLHMEGAAEGAVLYGTITDEVRRRVGARREDGSGIAGTLRAVHGVRVAVVFDETPDGVKVSLRAREGVRAHVIAEAFGGGGHHGAAGCTVKAPLREAVARVLAACELELAGQVVG